MSWRIKEVEEITAEWDYFSVSLAKKQCMNLETVSEGDNLKIFFLNAVITYFVKSSKKQWKNCDWIKKPGNTETGRTHF